MNDLLILSKVLKEFHKAMLAKYTYTKKEN